MHPKWVHKHFQISKNVILCDLGGVGAQSLRKTENPGLEGLQRGSVLGAIFGIKSKDRTPYAPSSVKMVPKNWF